MPRGFTEQRLEERFHEFYRRYFQRWRVLLGYAAMAWESPESWIRFLRNLADFLALRKAYEK